jgi:hypothetical protein
MLFDLRSKRRRRVVQVIYATLAVLMGGGLVFFGIGSDTSGGLFDAFTDNGGSGGSVSSELTDQAERLERQLRRDPQNEELLLSLVRTRSSAATSTITIDETTGFQQLSEEGRAELNEMATAWERYLKLTDEPSVVTARLVANNLYLLAQNSTTYADADANLADAAQAQAIVVEKQPNAALFFQLALYRYLSGDFAGGKAAGEEAAKLADSPSQKEQVESQLADVRKQAKRLQAAVKREAKGGRQELEDPLGGIGAGATP